MGGGPRSLPSGGLGHELKGLRFDLRGPGAGSSEREIMDRKESAIGHVFRLWPTRIGGGVGMYSPRGRQRWRQYG